MPDGFATTQWSLVLAARQAEADGEALGRLCRVYWMPIFAFLRRRGYSRADAEDHTQAFFADILQRDWLQRADPAQGRFRGFLRQSVRRFVGQERRAQAAQKRGGGVHPFSLDAIDRAERFLAAEEPGVGPDEAFDRAWARTILHRAMERLGLEQADKPRAALFEACGGFLLQPARAGEYDDIARRFGMSRGAVAIVVHRLGARYRELVRSEVAQTVDDPAMVDDELRHLLQAVSG